MRNGQGKKQVSFYAKKKDKASLLCFKLGAGCIESGSYMLWLAPFFFIYEKKKNLIKFGCKIAMECLDQNNSYKLIVQINTVQVSKPIHKEEEVGMSPSNAEREMVGFICLHHLQVYEHAD